MAIIGSTSITALHDRIIQVSHTPTTPLGAIAYNDAISINRGCRFAGLYINLIGGPQTSSGIVTCEIVSFRGAAHNRQMNPTVANATFDFQGQSNLVWILDGNNAPVPVPMEEGDTLKVDWSNPDGLDYGWGIYYIAGNIQDTITTTV
jgi:hypothetical protein